jgi:hypothetical protein
MFKGQTVLEEAEGLVEGPRQEAYGHPRDNYRRTAQLWSAILDTEISPEDVVLCMMGVKLARMGNAVKRDSIVDVAGYARVLEMVWTAGMEEEATCAHSE